jgi:hypothetical protein
VSWRRRMKTNVENSKKMGKHLEMFCVVVVEPRSIQVKVEQETNETRQEKKTKKSATLHWKLVEKSRSCTISTRFSADSA